MTAPDVRTAARAEAFNNHYSHKQVRDRYDADLLITGFVDGAVWGAALVSGGIVLSDFHGDGVYRDQQGRIWQTLDDTRAAVEATIAMTEARVTPTREQIAKAMWDATPTPDRPWEFAPEAVREAGYVLADAVLALMQDRTTT